MTKLNIGMIGAGFIGQLAHFTSFFEEPNCKILALAEYKPELRAKVAARYEIPKAYSSHLDLIADPDIDAVVVVTPRPFTGPIVLDCLKAGKHVLSEKPMVGSSEDGKILLDAAKAANVRYAVGYMKRYDAGVDAAKKALVEALKTGSLGTILAVHATCYMGNSYCNSYSHLVTDEKPDYSSSGWGIAPEWLPEGFHQQFGAYLNTYTHVTNLLRHLFDATPSVEFANLTDHGGQLAVLGFDDFVATLETGKMSHNGWSEVITVTFSDGEIRLSMPPALLRNVPATVEVYYAGKRQEKISPCIDWSWSFRRQAEAFVNDIVESKPMLISAEEGYKEILLTEAIWDAEMKRLGVAKIKEQSVA